MSNLLIWNFWERSIWLLMLLVCTTKRRRRRNSSEMFVVMNFIVSITFHDKRPFHRKSDVETCRQATLPARIAARLHRSAHKYPQPSNKCRSLFRPLSHETTGLLREEKTKVPVRVEARNGSRRFSSGVTETESDNMSDGDLPDCSSHRISPAS